MKTFKETPIIIKTLLFPFRLMQFIIYFIVAGFFFLINEPERCDSILDRIIDKGGWF